MFGLPAVVATLQGIGMAGLPRTPRWLCMQQRMEEARDVLAYLRPGVPKVLLLVRTRAGQGGMNGCAAWPGKE
jgi:hypothetical protein